MKVLVSRCLLGENCRYKGDSCKSEKVLALRERGYQLIDVCPECDGGLPTPRPAAEIVNGAVINAEGKDVTAQYMKGAENALRLALENDVAFAVLKTKSPSCGYGTIYDGTFTGKLIQGDGVTAKLLAENGIRVIRDTDL